MNESNKYFFMFLKRYIKILLIPVEYYRLRSAVFYNFGYFFWHSVDCSWFTLLGHLFALPLPLAWLNARQGHAWPARFWMAKGFYFTEVKDFILLLHN